MISILLPTRARPDNLRRLFESVHQTADDPKDIEFMVRLDEDDPRLGDYDLRDINSIIGPRDVLSKNWNECYAKACGPIYMHAGDDIIFQTPGWDTQVKQAFEEQPDKILFVHGDDGYWGDKFGTHGFLHKNWVDAIGYFVPPYFSSDWNDTWLNDVANMIDRRKYLPFVTEHMHYVFGKAPYDATHQEREERGVADNVNQMYAEMRPQRERDAEKLRKVMR